MLHNFVRKGGLCLRSKRFHGGGRGGGGGVRFSLFERAEIGTRVRHGGRGEGRGEHYLSIYIQLSIT